MTKKQLAYYAKHKLYAFPKLASGNKNPPHLKFIADKIQSAIESEEEKLLIISLPPRHGKSQLISKHAPAWILGNYPKKEIVLASYSGDLAQENSGVARDNFERWGPILWDVYPSKKVFNIAKWKTDQGGIVIARGVDGSTTGFGADVLIIDDYVKGHKDAESQTIRESIWNWWEAVAGSRLHPGAVVIILATRWHDDDLIGRLGKQQIEEGDDFPYNMEVINLPALAEEQDPMGRKEGEALWSWWNNRELLLKKQKRAGPYWWSALFQGRPVARGGTLFKSEWFRYWTRDSQGNYLCYREDHDKPLRVSKHELIIHAYVDPSLETKTINDPTGMLAWGYSRKHKIWILLDRINARIEHTRVLGSIKTFAFKNKASSIGIENEKLGKVLVKQSAGNDDVGGKKISFKEIPTGGVDKYARATTMANYFECERVFLPKDVIWLADYENSLVGFPRAAHDEDVDCTSMAEHMESKSALEDLLRKRR